MISARTGAALALLVAIAALGVAVAALMATIRDEELKPGRLVQSYLTNAYTGDPQLFPLDDFYIGRGSDGVLHAWYVYPPSSFGHMRGCRVVWDPAALAGPPAALIAPGAYVDPCSGARFDRDGRLIGGRADRGLDFFKTQAGIEGVVVDSRRLLCGTEEAGGPTATPARSPSATPPVTGTTEPGDDDEETCERVSPESEQR